MGAGRRMAQVAGGAAGTHAGLPVGCSLNLRLAFFVLLLTSNHLCAEDERDCSAELAEGEGSPSQDSVGEEQEQQQQAQQPVESGQPAASSPAVAVNDPPGRPPHAGNVAGMAAAGRDASVTPQQVRHGGQRQQEGEAGTPYDGVLALLRAGPLSTSSPHSFPRPRSTSHPPVGPNPAAAAVAPYPSPLRAAAASFLAAPDAGVQPLRPHRASRLGPYCGQGTPGLRDSLGARSRGFASTPVSMQPLAAGTSGAGVAAPPNFALAAAVSAKAPGGLAGCAAAATVPSPLAWTPMRSNLGAAGQAAPMSGLKRRAASNSPAGGLFCGCCAGSCGQGCWEAWQPR